MNEPTPLDAISYGFNVGIGAQENLVIGMLINTVDDEQYLLHMDVEAAQNVGTMLLGHVAAIQSTISRARLHA